MSTKQIQFLKQLLTKVADQQELIDYNYDFAIGLNKLDGFTSKIIHVTLSGKSKRDQQTKSLELLIKILPSNEKLQERNGYRDLFRREIYVYETILPLIKDFFAKSSLPSEIEYITKCYGSSFEKNNEALVLKNLVYDNYELWNCKTPMNDEHIRFILERYAHFHASGFALKHLYPDIWKETMKDFRKTLFHEDGCNEFVNMLSRILVHVIKGISLTKEEKVLEAIKKVDVWKALLSEYDNDEYFTWLHGDCWCNNFMFKYEDESKSKPSEVKFIDWQLFSIGSPASDFMYFYLANLSSEMYGKYQEYKTIYYENLRMQLECFNLKIERVYPRDEFDKQIKLYGKYGMLMSLLVIQQRLLLNPFISQEDLEGTDEIIWNRIDPEKGNLDEYFQLSTPLVCHCHQLGII